MAWVVDTCVVIDVLDHDPEFGLSSARRLQQLLSQGLLICPITMVELSSAFNGDLAAQKTFLDQAGIGYHETWTPADTETAHQGWAAYIAAKRTGTAPKRPVADILIGAFAANRRGLVTRNPADFARWYPHLKLK